MDTYLSTQSQSAKIRIYKSHVAEGCPVSKHCKYSKYFWSMSSTEALEQSRDKRQERSNMTSLPPAD